VFRISYELLKAPFNAAEDTTLICFIRDCVDSITKVSSFSGLLTIEGAFTTVGYFLAPNLPARGIL